MGRRGETKPYGSKGERERARGDRRKAPWVGGRGSKKGMGKTTMHDEKGQEMCECVCVRSRLQQHYCQGLGKGYTYTL